MGRAWKIGIAVGVVLLLALAANALVVGAKTENAEVTVPGGRILDLAGGEMQVVEGGPRRGEPIVLVHCFSCAIDWWDGVRPRLERRPRGVALDPLCPGGPEAARAGPP